MVHGVRSKVHDAERSRPLIRSGGISRWRRGLAAAGLVLVTALPAAVAPPAHAAPAVKTNNDRSTAQEITISYSANRGIGVAPDVQRVAPGASARIAQNSFTRQGYVFEEWNTRPDGSGTDHLPGATVVPRANLTLYAQWAPKTEVYLNTSAPSQVFRTVDPALIGVHINMFQESSDGEGGEPPSPGTIEIRNHGVLMQKVAADPYELTIVQIPASLPLGRAEFTARFIPTDPYRSAITTDPVRFTVVRASTVTKVTARQQTLSAADQRKYQVRSGMSVSVQVVGRGTRDIAPGAVALTIDGKVTTLRLVNGRAKTPLVPTAAGARKIAATYRPNVDWWVRSTGWASIDVR